MISIEDVTVAYGGFVLLDKINFHISESDKIGLVGKNGAGKSTILKLIADLQSPTSGRVDKPRDLSVGYLTQIMEHHRGRTVLEEAMTAFESTAAIEGAIARVTSELETRTDYESDAYSALIEHLANLNDRLEMSHAEPPEVQARRTLLGLGFLDDELGRATETFSQGWNMRIELAKILLRQPDVLLLDEPTNHLDIESIEWLEEYLKARRCALLLVSHDRRFLDTVTNRTVEVMLGHIHDYKVPYTKYLELRAERIQQQHVRLPEQDLGQFDAHVPALGEGLRGTGKLAVEEAQAEQRPARLHLGRLRMAHLQAVVQVRKMLDQCGIGIGFIVCPGLEFARNARNFPFDRGGALEGGHRLLEDRPSAVMLHDLREIADRQVLRLVHAAGGRALQVRDQLEDGGLPRPVLAHEADLVGLADVEVDLVQQDETSIGDSHILDRNHMKISSSKNSGRWKSGFGVPTGAQER